MAEGLLAGRLGWSVVCARGWCLRLPARSTGRWESLCSVDDVLAIPSPSASRPRLAPEVVGVNAPVSAVEVDGSSPVCRCSAAIE